MENNSAKVQCITCKQFLPLSEFHVIAENVRENRAEKDISRRKPRQCLILKCLRYNVLLANGFCHYPSFADTKTDQGALNIVVLAESVRKQSL